MGNTFFVGPTDDGFAVKRIEKNAFGPQEKLSFLKTDWNVGGVAENAPQRDVTVAMGPSRKPDGYNV